MNNKESLGELALDFLSSVDEATCLLEKKFGARCILRLWRSGKIKRCGVIKGYVTYELHGAGCAVKLPHVLVDFDYGPDGRIDGFDVWRLFRYATELPNNILSIKAKKLWSWIFGNMSHQGDLNQCLRTEAVYIAYRIQMNNHHNNSRKKNLKIKQIARLIAIKNIAKSYLDTLTTEERDSHILNWWPLDENNPNFLAISTKLKNLLLNNEEPPKNIESLLTDELILVGLKSSYIGVTNDYLAEQLAKLGYGTYEVEGDIEHLNACPCCEYRTLSTISDYDICELCMWEDDGTAAPESYSHPNHMTLSTAKKQFIEKNENLPLNKWVKAS